VDGIQIRAAVDKEIVITVARQRKRSAETSSGDRGERTETRHIGERGNRINT